MYCTSGLCCTGFVPQYNYVQCTSGRVWWACTGFVPQYNFVHLAHVGWACTGFVPQYNYVHCTPGRVWWLVLALYYSTTMYIWPCWMGLYWLCTTVQLRTLYIWPCLMGLYWLCTSVQLCTSIGRVGRACTGFVPQYNYVHPAHVGWACTGFVPQYNSMYI